MDPQRGEIEGVLALVAAEARAYFAGLDERPARAPRAEEVTRPFHAPLPEQGVGAAAALGELTERGVEATVATGGPRCFHFVIGGSTPAALGADWLATAWDQIAYAWVTSPLAVELELVSLAWLRELFGLPAGWSGIMTTGATMANFVGLAAARQWWGERHGFDVAERGLAGAPPVPVLSSGHIHGSAVKCLSMLGIGRGSLRRLTRDSVGNLDLAALEAALRGLDGAPAIVIATVGEPNAGASDPVVAVADLAERYGAWLHVDGAFGLFARLSPRTAHIAAGVERARSVCVDGHKWLNVPYDSGYGFVADGRLLAKAFRYTGEYLPDPDDPRPNLGTIGPESSRRARALAVWATLRAYGAAGHRAMVERHLDLAQRLARRVDEAPDLERLAEVPLCVVCFRCNPGGLPEEALDRLNQKLGEALLADGRFYVGTTTYAGKVALRPALVNWRTREQDVDAFVEVVREVGRRVGAELAAEAPTPA
ncbi:MAG TPA: pyridoxal-dependent decarboxylase [Thermoanaerobaculia bacterium]|jgi:glutamate/tyrosine decarboxylase-like PLP-dependent enzyme|nr:pyridoxal-dependent decarboxylase [Thermoanaerobaculia bacterium]